MLLTSGDVRRIGSQITADNYSFDVDEELIYPYSAVTTKNDVSLESKRRITLANMFYNNANGQLNSRDLPCTTKLIFCKMLILPVFLPY